MVGFSSFGSAKVAVEQTFKSLSVASFVAGHFVHSVVDRVEVQFLRALGESHLALGRAVLGVYAHLEVLLGAVGDDLTEQLGKLRGVLRLFVSRLLPVQTDLGIALTVRHTRHRQIHTDLGALAHKVGAQALDDLLVDTLRNTDYVLSRPGALAALLVELIRTDTANGADLRRLVAVVNITANLTYLLHNCFPPKL